MKCRTNFSIGDNVRIIEVLDPGLNRQNKRAYGTITEIRFDKRGVFFHVEVPVTGGAAINVISTKVGRIPKSTSRKPLSKGVQPDAPKEAPPVSSSAPAGPAGVPHTSTATGNGIVAQCPAGAVD